MGRSFRFRGEEINHANNLTFFCGSHRPARRIHQLLDYGQDRQRPRRNGGRALAWSRRALAPPSLDVAVFLRPEGRPSPTAAPCKNCFPFSREQASVPYGVARECRTAQTPAPISL